MADATPEEQETSLVENNLAENCVASTSKNPRIQTKKISTR